MQNLKDILMWMSKQGYALCVALFFVGVFVWHLRADWQQTDTPILGQRATYILQVRDYADEKARSDAYRVAVIGEVDTLTNTPVYYTDVPEMILYIGRDTLRSAGWLGPGQRLAARTIFTRPESTTDFDYGQYLRRQGIAGTGYVYAGRYTLLDSIPLHGLSYRAREVQHQLYEQYEHYGIRQPALGILSALTLGYRTPLQRETRQAFAATGAMHVLAVSGLHVSIITGILLVILTLGGLYPPLYQKKGRRLWLAVTTVVLLWGYAYMTGLSPSVVRTVLMYSLMQLAMLTDRYVSAYRVICLSAVMILLVRPLDIVSMSFWLSYSAVVAIVFFSKIAKPYMVLLPANRVLRWIVGLIVASLAAWLGTMPITLCSFGYLSVYFLLSSLVVIPAATVIIVMAMLFFLSLLLPTQAVSVLLAQGLNRVIDWVYVVITAIEQWPHATISVSVSWPVGLVLLAYVYGIFAAATRQKGWTRLITMSILTIICFALIYLLSQVGLEQLIEGLGG